MKEIGFFRNHIDTIAIMGLNLAIAAILIGMWTANTSRIDAANARSDQLYQAFQEESRQFHQEMKDLHCRLYSIEEKGRK